MKKKIYSCIIFVLITLLNSSNTIPPIPEHINQISNGNWDAYKQILERNTDYLKMHEFIDEINENGYNQRYFGIMEVRAILFKLSQFTWDERQKKEISEYLSGYYLHYTKDENFLKDQALLFVDSKDVDKMVARNFISPVQNKLQVYSKYEGGYKLGWNTDIPALILKTILLFDPKQALPIIEKEWIFYYNKSLESSFYFEEFKFFILQYLEWALTNTNEYDFKKLFFSTIQNIANNIVIQKKDSIKKDLSYFFEVKEVFDLNDQKKAWELLKNKQDILKTSADLNYESLLKISFRSYDIMRDAYYTIDDNILFKLEEKAIGNEKDYYAKILMTVLHFYVIHDKEEKLTESKYKKYRNVIENLAKRTTDPKMKAACENVLTSAEKRLKRE